MRERFWQAAAATVRGVGQAFELAAKAWQAGFHSAPADFTRMVVDGPSLAGEHPVYGQTVVAESQDFAAENGDFLKQLEEHAKDSARPDRESGLDYEL